MNDKGGFNHMDDLNRMDLNNAGEKTDPKDNSQDIPAEILPFLSNQYVAYYKDGKLFYKPGFHKALLDKLNEGLNARQAYDALGFNTQILGYDRAYGAAKRARQKEANNTLMDDQTIEAEVLDEGAVPEEVPADEPEWLDEVLANPYVTYYRKGRIHYTDQFYVDILKLVEEGKTATEAYRALGFPVDLLGSDRAAMAVQYAQVRKEKIVPPTYKVDGTVPFDVVMKREGIEQFDPNNPVQAAMAYDRLVFLEVVFKELKKKM